MSIINHRLSRRVAYGFEGGPEWNTQIIELDNGMEARNGLWAYPRQRYSAQYLHLDDEARREVLNAFYAARGRLYAFRFQDWNDYQAINEPLYTYYYDNYIQLTKTYRFGDAEYIRPIRAIVDATVVDKDGNPVDGTLDEDRGVFYPYGNLKGKDCTWSGEFDVWVRFDSDFNAFALNQRNNESLIATANIELIEAKNMTFNHDGMIGEWP